MAICPVAAWMGHEAWRHEITRHLSERCLELSHAKDWPELRKTAERWSRLDSGRADPWLFRAEAAAGVEDWAEMARQH